MKCPKCGAAITADALAGLCPKCVAKLALAGAAADLAAAIGRGAPPKVRYFGDYELLEEIGRGGMGVVYKARQASLNRIVAVKMLLHGDFASAEFVKRFHAEAEAAASLQHPNIVAIHEVGLHEGLHYFSMDYVEGQSLAELADDQPMPPERAARYVCLVAEAIHYAHQRGILHRDLKPSNIVVDALDQPRITDFGLAKRLDASQPSSLNPQLTLTGQVLGAPSYMPPEQAAGKRGGVGVASDVYALGAVLYHLLTGRPPFLAETLPETLAQVQTQEPTPPRQLNPSVPRDLETIGLKCLCKAPRDRYATAAALAEDLHRWQAGEPISARAMSQRVKVWRWCRRHVTPTALVAAAVVALFAGFVSLRGLLQRGGHPPDAGGSRADSKSMTSGTRPNGTADLSRVVSGPGGSATNRSLPIVCADINRNLWLCDPWGTNRFLLADTGDCSEPVWSLDGSEILLMRGNREAWAIKPDASRFRRVGVLSAALGSKVWIAAPVWTGPDRYLVYCDTQTPDMCVLLEGNLAGQSLREVWRPALVQGPKWGFMYDYSPRTRLLAFIAAEANWTPWNDLYLVDPVTWGSTNVWSDPGNDHEDGLPRWAARTDRIAWQHAVQAGLAPKNHVVGILDMANPERKPRWVGPESGDLWLQDWTEDDHLLVLDKSDGKPRLRILDDQGVMVRSIPCDPEVLSARWRKFAAATKAPAE